MRFTRISLQNLASWRGEHVLDLNGQNPVEDGEVCYKSVDNAPLFLIHGVTGAGKSSLIDAVLLALFGRTLRLSNDSAKTSSEEKAQEHPAQLISRGEGFMKAEVDVEVGEELYRFRYYVQRANKKPDGNIQKAVRTIVKLDSETGDELEHYDTEKQEALKEVHEDVLGGLTFEEFSRSVVLAQNEFSRFLDADAKEKSALIAKLTGTEIFARYGAAIKAAEKEAKGRKEELEEEGKALLKADALVATREALGHDRQSREAARTERDEASAARSELEKHIEAAAKIAKLEGKVEEEEARGEISPEDREALKRHDLVLGNEEDLRALSARGAALVERRDDLTEVEEELDGIDPPTADQTVERQSALVDLLEEHEQLAEAADASKHKLERVKGDREKLRARIEECKKKLRERRANSGSSRHAALVEYVEHAPLLFGLEAGAALSAAHRDRANDYLSKHANLWASSSTNRFADHLALVAELVDESTDASAHIELEQQKRELESLEKELAALDEELEAATAVESQTREELEAFCEEHGSKDKLEAEREQVEAALEAAKRRTELLEKQKSIQGDIASREENVRLLEEKLAALFKNLGDDIDTLLGHLLDAPEVERIERGSKDLREAEKKLAEARREHEPSLLGRAKLDEVAARVGLAPESDVDAILEALEKRYASKEEEVAGLGKKIEEAEEKIAEHEELVERGLETAIDEARARYNRLVLLHKVAGGEQMQEMKQRLNLGVLLKITNARLERLTNGRLALVQTKASNTAEFDLKDLQANRHGSRYTLSGGEKFLVSLALALGLRDMQGRDAARMPRSMFIDEGFGALDGERRDALLQVLEQLGSENDTQLGIISHVSEIKDQMDVSIEIEKINEQSRFADESAAN
jgi:exonuclease SbcC